ncbi:hypothetical protein CHU98_g5253 [Xylaria longipes]|nr:hypothetical protein CHU98_g5253 [Xylaria longipes]
MFSTLRSQESDGGSFVLVPTAASFEEARRVKPVQIACALCRTLTALIPISPTASEISTSKSATELSTGDEHSAKRPHTLEGGVQPGAPHTDIFNAFDFSMLQDDYPTLDITSEFFAESSPNDSIIRESGMVPPVTPTGVSSSSTTLTQECDCLEQIVRTYEMVEIYLIWSRHEACGRLSLDLDGIFRCQKEALSSCESVLECTTCDLLQQYALLIITICNKLLESIIEMGILSPPRFPARHEKRPVWETPPATHWTEGNFPTRTQRLGLRDAYSDHDSLNIDTQKQPASILDQWKIDDEDKRQVLTSLLMTRASRLRTIIRKLEHVTISKQWLAHKCMVQDLMERLANQVLFSTA